MPSLGKGEREKGQEAERERKEQRMRAALGDRRVAGLRIASLRAKGPEEGMERKRMPKEILGHLKQFQTKALNL